MEENIIDQVYIQNNSIFVNTIKDISKGIVKIIYNNNISTGFLMKLYINKANTLYFMITCNHCIKEEMLGQEIVIYYQDLTEEKSFSIKLDKNKRFIKFYSKSDNLDVTVVRIFKSEIKDYMNFLIPDKNYTNGYDYYLENNNIFLFGYPKNLPQKFSLGKISSYENYYFLHICDTEDGNSGSVIVNEKGEIVGVHKGYNIDKYANLGIFIGPIVEDLLKNEQSINSIKEETIVECSISINSINKFSVEEENENLINIENTNKNLQKKK